MEVGHGDANRGLRLVEVESYLADKTSGLHGKAHIRPVPGGPHPTDLRVECSKKMIDPAVHPIGTRFRIWAKLTDREGGGQFLYTSWRWGYEVVPA
jgi:hypothetical protein